jgi:heme oxygenase
MGMQEIVDEANLVFNLSVGVCEELEGLPFKAHVDTGDQ